MNRHESTAPVSLDAVDVRLLGLLAEDGRASYAALAPQVELSAPAVRLRVQRLMDLGVLQVVGVSDPTSLGYPVQAMVAVSTHGNVRAVADEIAAIENVIYQVLTTGEHDLLVEVVCRTAEELLAVVNDRIRAVPGVSSTRVWQYYRIHTHRFNVPPTV
ncbi:MAG: Lrp/AsnC family transcriptional regulator [Kineosporiaceae bacterium]|nr:Lrp/AsnC family transcriptional regulator [Kineosporiaceae bacterium]